MTHRASMHRRRGAALVEFAMAIPLLATVIALTFFFGYAMTNQQHVIASARHVAWDKVKGGATPSSQELNTAFFDGKAGQSSVTLGTGPRDTLDALVRRAERRSLPAGELIAQCIGQPWPGGQSARVSADFPSSVPAWRKFTGAIQSRHVREGVEWRRTPPGGGGQRASYLVPIRDQFLSELDQVVWGIADAPLRDSLRRLYLQRW